MRGGAHSEFQPSSQYRVDSVSKRRKRKKGRGGGDGSGLGAKSTVQGGNLKMPREVSRGVSADTGSLSLKAHSLNTCDSHFYQTAFKDPRHRQAPPLKPPPIPQPPTPTPAQGLITKNWSIQFRSLRQSYPAWQGQSLGWRCGEHRA